MLAERALSTQREVDLEDERAAAAADGRTQPPNRRTGRSRKTVSMESGKVVVDSPRGRNGGFDPMLIAKYQRRFREFDRKIIRMQAGGMTPRAVQGHSEAIYGLEASFGLISALTDAVMEEGAGWQNRPLERCPPIVFMDAIRGNIRKRRCRLEHAGLPWPSRSWRMAHATFWALWFQADCGREFWAKGLKRPAQPGRCRHPDRPWSSSWTASSAAPRRSRRPSPRPGSRPASSTWLAPFP